MNLTKEKRATFTPGPWVVMGKAVLEATRYREILWLGHNTRSAIPKEEKNANARLIAAAPELLEQCKLFEKVLTHLINSGDSGADLERDKLREVLAKVEGGEG
jgi:hypothetical protein